jgi:hypothetical protein
MSELRSAIETYRGETTAELPDARLEEDFAELQAASGRLEAERLRRLAELERRRCFERDGHLSVASWLSARFGMAWGSARRDVHLARALEAMPLARRALEDGDVPLSAVRVLAEARNVDPEAFSVSEGYLVHAARLHAPGDLHRIAAYWRQAAERDRATSGDDVVRARRRLHASVTFMGAVRVDGDLDPEAGESLLTALRAVMDAEARAGGQDERTPAQWRADALGEICRQWLDGQDRPTVAGERPHVTLTVDVDALRAAGDRTAPGVAPGLVAGSARARELDHAGPVEVETARRMACDASVMRVVMTGESQPLDVGRRTPVVPPAMRRAVIVRDRTCRFPGCDRPHSWCDAHHVVHWADGGPTAVGNLVLLCRRHHRTVHERGGLSLHLEDGRPVFRRPDGSVLEDRAPP